MRLTTVTQVSVDGVMQGNGPSRWDRRLGFERDGWALRLFEGDDEATRLVDQVYQRADAFLFGRRTYEIFAESWGTWADPGDSPIWTALHQKPVYGRPRYATASPDWRRWPQMPVTARHVPLDRFERRDRFAPPQHRGVLTWAS